MSDIPTTPPKLETPTDVLIHALEEVERISEVVVVFRVKDTDNYGCISNVADVIQRMGMLDACKLGIFKVHYIG